MPTPKERLRGAEEKFKRARHHIDELAEAVDNFKTTTPFAFGRKDDPQTGDWSHHVARSNAVAPAISAIAGDVIHNVIGALDHIAYQMVLAGNQDVEPKHVSYIYFPVADGASEYPDRRDGRLNGATSKAKQAVDMVEPYKGGKGEILWVLKKLNNVDKHRLLLTVSYHLLPSNDAERLKPGDAVLADSPLNPDLDRETKYGVGMALFEPKICKPQGLAKFLEDALKFVEALLPGFEESFG